jgi:hypothetical protein
LIKDITIKPEALKLVQERVGNILQHTGIGNDFLNRTPMDQLRERTDQWHYMKIKSFCVANGHQTEEAGIEWEKIFANFTTDRG